MKKIIILTFFILICVNGAAYASEQFDKVLTDEIGEYGVLDGGEGIIYAAEKNFEGGDSLLIIRAASESLICEVYDDADGIQLTDSLEIDCSGGGAYRLAVQNADGRDFLLLVSEVNGTVKNEVFTMENDAFKRISDTNRADAEYIAGFENGEAKAYTPTENVYAFLNDLREETVASYTFANRINSLSADEEEKIKRTLSACADVMRFDIKNYDYDTLFKYILYTHKNFAVLTDIPSGSSKSSSLGYNNVSIVRSEYIDYVMENIFRLTPEKPPVNNLLSRGFCYSGGYYYYTGGFDVYFSTEIRALTAVYDMGGGVIFVVFSDIYSEGDAKIPEYSFAVLQKTSGIYSILRLGMGENLPPKEEIRAYSPFSTYGGSSWDGVSSEDDSLSRKFLLPVLLLVISVGTVGIVCSVVVLIKSRR